MMRERHRITGLFLWILLAAFWGNMCTGGLGASDSPVLKGPYLGQKPPGMTPELFAPGIICTNYIETASAFSKDGKLFVFRRHANQGTYPDIYMMREKNKRWTKPVLLSFQGQYRAGDFTFAPDGKTLYFASNRPLKGNRGYGDNLWKVEIPEGNSPNPQPLPPVINSELHESYPSLAANGNLYFFRRMRKNEDEIYMSRLVNGKYMEAENLGPAINSEYDEWDAYIAPDESYIIFCSTKPGGYGRDDLYISFRKKAGLWTRALNMGPEMNSPASDNRPYVTIDGKYLFFTSSRKAPKDLAAAKRAGSRDIYWVDSEIIKTYKKKAFK